MCTIYESLDNIILIDIIIIMIRYLIDRDKDSVLEK